MRQDGVPCYADKWVLGDVTPFMMRRPSNLDNNSLS